MFSEHAVRMIREFWKGPIPLAEELFAVFSSAKIPLSHNGPITLSITGPQAPLTIRQFGTGPLVSFVNADGEPAGGIEIGEDGVPRIVNEDGEEEEPEPAEAVRVEFVGTVVSGTGTTYTVTLDTAEVVTAIQQSINADQTIPPGTVATVILDTGVYIMQAPVFA